MTGDDSIASQFLSGAVSSGIMSGVSGEGKLYRKYGADGYKIIKLQANEAEAARAVMSEIDRNGFDGDYDKLVDAFVDAHDQKLQAIKDARKTGKLTDKQLTNIAAAITNPSSLKEFATALESENARSAIEEYLDRQVKTGLEDNTAENASSLFQQSWISRFDNDDVTFKIGTPNELTDPKTGTLARGVEIDDTVYVNPANIREFYQLAMHEGAGHVYLDSDPVVREKFIQSIETNEDLAKIFRSYDESIVRGYSNSDLSNTQIDLKNMQDEEIAKKYNIPLETLISERVAHFLERFIADSRSFSKINVFQKDASFVTCLRNYLRSLKSWFKNRTDTRINAPFIEMLNEALDEIKSKKAENRAEAQEKGGYTVKQTATAKAAIVLEGNQKVVRIDNTEIADKLKAEDNKEERRRILSSYLKANLVGKTIQKKVIDQIIEIKSTGGDLRELTHNEHRDTSLALTQVDELIEASEFIGWAPNMHGENGKNDYFLHFKVTVELDGDRYQYDLHVGHNRSSGNYGLYTIINYKQKNEDSYRKSSAGLSSINNIAKDEEDGKKFAKSLKRGLSVAELDGLKKEFLHKIKDEGMTLESQELSEKIQQLTDSEIEQILDYLRANGALKTYDEDDFSDMGDDIFESLMEDPDFVSNMLEEELAEIRRETEQDRLERKEIRRKEYERKSDEEKRFISFEKAYNRDYDKLVRVLNLKMSDQAKAYFKDTVLRRGNDVNKQSLEGDIIPMFHGTPDSDMYFFDSERIGENGTQRGYGFYLTNSLDFAKGYTGDEGNPGKVILAFANITNPAPDTKAKSKITKEMLGKFIKQHVDPTAESGFLSNWGDVSTTSYEKILQKYLDSAFEYNDTDWQIITQLYHDQDELGFDDFFKAITKDFGYDGYIAWHRADGGTIAVAFNSNQIKDVSNMAPTANPDIRYAKNLKGVSTEATDPDFKVPSRYIYDSANARNERYVTYQAVEDLMRSSAIDILVLTESIADDADYRNAQVRYSNKSRVEAVDEIWRLLNKTDGTSASDIKKAIAKLFSSVSIRYSNNKYVDMDKVLAENPSVKETIERSVLDHMNALLNAGTDSKKSRTEQRVQALLDTISDIKDEFKSMAKEMRAKMDAVRALQKTIDGMKGFGKTSLDVTIDNDSLRMGTKIIDPFRKMPYRKGSGFSLKPNKGNLGLKAQLADILENYTAEKMEDGVFAYSDELRAQIQELRDSLPEPETKVWKLKDGTTEEHLYYATLNAEQTKLANAIVKNTKGIFNASVKSVREVSAPLALTGTKAVEFSLAHPKVTFLTSNAYVNEFASSWAALEGVLGDSKLSDEMTIGMNGAMSEANMLEYQQRARIADKVDELGLKRRIAVAYRLKGMKIQRGVLVDIYASLTSKTNFDALNQNGMSYRDPKTEKVIGIFDQGEAKSFLAKLEQELTKDEKALAKWLKSDFYGGKEMRRHYEATQKNRGVAEIVELEDYYGLSVYNAKASDVEFMARAPRSFGYDKDRVRHTHRFLASNAISRALAYTRQVAIEEYVRPQYKKVMGALNYKANGGVSVYEMLDRNYKPVLSHIMSMLESYMGVDPSGKRGKGSAFASQFFRGYTTSLLALNPGTPFRQTISALYSMFGVRSIARAMWDSMAMPKEMRNEYKRLVSEMGELALRGRDGKVVFGEAGARMILEATRATGDALMTPIRLMDRATISLLTRGAMNLATRMGYEVGSDDHISFSKDMVRVMLETQIGRLPTDVSMASAGYGKTGMLGRILTFMGGPARAALATVSNKLKIAQIVEQKGLTKESVRNAIKNADAKISQWENAVAQAETDVDNEMEGAEERLAEARARLLEARAEKLQASNDERMFARFIAMGGKKWPLDALLLMIFAALFNSAINAFSKRLRGKEDWKWTDDDWRTLVNDSWQYMAFGWLPAVNSVTNAINGYDTSYPAGAMLSMFGNLIKDGIAFAKDGDYKPFLRDAIEALSAFTGLPFKNAYGLVYGGIRVASPSAAEVLHDAFYTHQDASVGDVLKAVEEGRHQRDRTPYRQTVLRACRHAFRPRSEGNRLPL